MNNHASLVIASILGLVAGMSHGMVSHYQNLPFSLSEQVLESINVSNGKSFN
ncbi:hypothetical protein [Pleurocapsa sp. CCALA 161]|uniref:hypothetical protein n=1 Tax=Pleurocapsa sp. CCALA 161 TaxID=2107688 RepID=UPI0018EAF4C3|nr:hypothetical protein [Pleurocapsa sp. CCALA 161]